MPTLRIVTWGHDAGTHVPDGATSDGICDLVGNVWEWSGDMDSTSMACLLGGSWSEEGQGSGASSVIDGCDHWSWVHQCRFSSSGRPHLVLVSVFWFLVSDLGAQHPLISDIAAIEFWRKWADVSSLTIRHSERVKAIPLPQQQTSEESRVSAHRKPPDCCCHGQSLPPSLPASPRLGEPAAGLAQGPQRQARGSPPAASFEMNVAENLYHDIYVVGARTNSSLASSDNSG